MKGFYFFLSKTECFWSFRDFTRNLIITNKAVLDFCQQKVRVRVASWNSERLKNQGLRKLTNFGKILETTEFDREYQAGCSEGKFRQLFYKTPKNQQ